MGDFVPGLVPETFVGDAPESSLLGVGPRVVRADAFAAGFREARLDLCARALDLSLANSRAESCFVAVLSVDDLVVVEAVEAGLLVALFLAPLIFDGRLVTTFASALSEAAWETVGVGVLIVDS